MLDNCLILKYNNSLLKIELEKILYITNNEISSELITNAFDCYIIKDTLLNLNKKLNNEIFIRVHCNYLVNINYITHIILFPDTMLVINNLKTLPVSKHRKNIILKKVNEHFRNKYLL